MPVSEHDVETEIYERLYAHPHPDGRDGVKKPLLIVDRPLGADGDDEAEPVLRDRASRASRPALGAAGRTAGAALMAAGRTAGAALMAAAQTAGATLLAGARAAGPAIVEAGGKTRQAMGDLGPVVDRSSAAVRRHPAAAGAIVAALVAIPVLALILASAGRSEPAHVHLLAPRPATLLTSPPAAVRPNAQRQASPSTTSTANQSSTTAPLTSGDQAGTGTTTLRHRSPTHAVAKHRSTHRAAPAKPQPRPAPPIRKPTSHERPAHAPTLTSPTTPPAGTTPTTPGGTNTTTTGGAAPGN